MAAKQTQQQYTQPTHKTFLSLPHAERGLFLAFIHNGGAPEDYSNLDFGPISKKAKFEIIEHFEVSKKSRYGRELLPCAMCSRNKFLRGALIWIPERESIAIIGNCCADPANQAKADINYNKRKAKDFAEAYLLENIPSVRSRMWAIGPVEQVALGQEKLHKALRRNYPVLLKELGAAKRENCEMYRFEDIRASSSVAEFTKGGLRTARTSFGRFQGKTAVLSSYRPSQKINIIKNRLRPFVQFSDEPAALDYILQLGYNKLIEDEKHLSEATKMYTDICEKMNDFTLFFSQKNIQLLNRWKGSDGNSFEIKLSSDRSRMSGSDGGGVSSMQISPIALSKVSDWF